MNLRRSLRRLRHWRAFAEFRDPAANEKSLAALLSLLKGARVAIVGNAQSLLETSYGDEIDQHDVVVRLNRGLIKVPAAQGTRTDILGVACDMSHAEIAGAFGAPRVVWLTPMRELVTDDLLSRQAELAVVSIPAWQRLQLRIGGARPSAGLIMLDLLLDRGNCAGIDLYGFDWKASKTFYHSDERHQRVSAKRRWHDWTLERELVQRWAAENATIRIR